MMQPQPEKVDSLQKKETNATTPPPPPPPKKKKGRDIFLA